MVHKLLTKMVWLLNMMEMEMKNNHHQKGEPKRNGVAGSLFLNYDYICFLAIVGRQMAINTIKIICATIHQPYSLQLNVKNERFAIVIKSGYKMIKRKDKGI